MALEQTTIVDLVQIDQNSVIMVRERVDIFDSATPTNIIASNYYRTSYTPGSDVSAADAKVKATATALWTPEVIAAYQAMIAEQSQLGAK
jgi:hypothetical protein